MSGVVVQSENGTERQSWHYLKLSERMLEFICRVQISAHARFWICPIRILKGFHPLSRAALTISISSLCYVKLWLVVIGYPRRRKRSIRSVRREHERN